MSKPSLGRLALSIIGRTLMVIVTTIIGGLVGLVVALSGGISVMGRNPGAGHMMGAEAEGIGGLIIFLFSIIIGLVGGAIAGVFLGAVGAVLWPRPGATDGSAS